MTWSWFRNKGSTTTFQSSDSECGCPEPKGNTLGTGIGHAPRVGVLSAALLCGECGRRAEKGEVFHGVEHCVWHYCPQCQEKQPPNEPNSQVFWQQQRALIHSSFIPEHDELASDDSDFFGEDDDGQEEQRQHRLSSGMSGVSEVWQDSFSEEQVMERALWLAKMLPPTTSRPVAESGSLSQICEPSAYECRVTGQDATSAGEEFADLTDEPGSLTFLEERLLAIVDMWVGEDGRCTHVPNFSA